MKGAAPLGFFGAVEVPAFPILALTVGWGYTDSEVGDDLADAHLLALAIASSRRANTSAWVLS